MPAPATLFRGIRKLAPAELLVLDLESGAERRRCYWDVPAAGPGAPALARILFERNAVLVETRDPDRCYEQIGDAVLAQQVAVSTMTSPDNNLGAVFEYLTGDGGRRHD